ncbi:MAG TPA: peptidoglycan editing factor PgeF [Anaerolineaceae bacterium]|jgi:YfiH family protein|nr:peptidoglycan editing factor PgeF [Anaerolineaceae bacterium]HOE02687.1 peptidoglycan editing factor PgeF [Anaerolineaceae bacterium]HPD62536.1 peptidoglycan editing factor PgeF [Anaerolineaceae bacterium]HQK05085.1 peptidoglycan editing factor PgeF [Anaerolineaceae bacterium]HUM62195.1 peptidoglycan editing factor PgeF [Anaerolineaceae bacterium]
MKVTHTENGLEVFSFAHPDFEGAQHGFFTRKGGVSHGFYQSLNLGGSIGDNPEHVLENKHRVMQAINRQPNSFYEVWQIHSTKVVHCDTHLAAACPRTKADGIFTSNTQVTLMMRFADCVPIIFYDPVVKVVGIVHAGWVGTVNRIIEKAIKGAIKTYGCNPENLIAGIGPSIGPDHYEVGADVVQKVKASFKKQADQVLTTQNGRVYFDLWNANRLILWENGITRVHLSNLCTACDTKNWYSHRAEKGKTGRFAAVIHLTQ